MARKRRNDPSKSESGLEKKIARVLLTRAKSNEECANRLCERRCRAATGKEVLGDMSVNKIATLVIERNPLLDSTQRRRGRRRTLHARAQALGRWLAKPLSPPVALRAVAVWRYQSCSPAGGRACPVFVRPVNSVHIRVRPVNSVHIRAAATRNSALRPLFVLCVCVGRTPAASPSRQL